MIDKSSNVVGTENLINLFEMGDITWNFGFNQSEISDVINKYNLTLIEDVRNSYYQEKYLRPIKSNLTCIRN